MHNKVQQRFDRSIRDAVAVAKRANANKPRRDVKPPETAERSTGPKGRLYLCPETGATVWAPIE